MFNYILCHIGLLSPLLRHRVDTIRDKEADAAAVSQHSANIQPVLSRRLASVARDASYISPTGYQKLRHRRLAGVLPASLMTSSHNTLPGDNRRYWRRYLTKCWFTAGQAQ